jgi:hypothetical protein
MGDVLGDDSVDLMQLAGDPSKDTGVFSLSWTRMVGMLVSIVRPKVVGLFAGTSFSSLLVELDADVGRESCISTSASCCDEEYDPTPFAPLGTWKRKSTRNIAYIKTV